MHHFIINEPQICSIRTRLVFGWKQNQQLSDQFLKVQVQETIAKNQRQNKVIKYGRSVKSIKDLQKAVVWKH